MKKPTPKTVRVECSVCGLDWAEHEKLAKKAKRANPNLDDCVALLKAELAKPRQPFVWQGSSATAALPKLSAWRDNAGGIYQ